MITDRELARYISSNLHLYLADEDKPVECKVVTEVLLPEFRS